MRRNSLYKPSKFRAGIFSLATNSNSLSLYDNAGVTAAYKLKGTVKEMFKKIDIDNSGTLERNEVEILLNSLFDGTTTKLSQQQIDEMFAELDLDNDNLIDFDEFSHWYLKSGELFYLLCFQIECLHQYVYTCIRYNREKITI